MARSNNIKLDPVPRYFSLPYRYVCKECLDSHKDEIMIHKRCLTCGGDMQILEKGKGLIDDKEN